jgi:hypothetical protein
MQIHTSSNTKTYVIIAFSLAIVLLLGLVFSIENQPAKTDVVKVKQDDPTSIKTSSESIANLINTNSSYLYKDENLFVFATQDGIIPKITFAYKTPLTARETNDLVFIHIFLKDTGAIKTPYYNITFRAPKFLDTIVANGQEYVLLTKPLTSKPFKDGVIPFQDIQHINMGRFTQKKGRSLNIKQAIIEDINIQKNISKILIPKKQY